MSNLIHCDGPRCSETRDADRAALTTRAQFEGGWLRVSQGDGVQVLDFHSRDCLAAWNAEQPDTTSTTVVDGR